MSDELDPKLVERARTIKQRLMATADQDARLVKRQLEANWLRELGFPGLAADVEKLPLTEQYFPLEQPEPELEDDYEALGYPETEVTDAICGTEEMRYTVDLFLGSVMGDMDERLVRLRLIEKKNDDPSENG